MKRLYVFRLDGAKANDGYFDKRKEGTGPGETVGYRGTRMSIGRRWRPDGVEVEISGDGRTAYVTVVELEANTVGAMTSCRKYLPEPSGEVLKEFLRYLAGVVKQCRKTDDPRLGEIGELIEALRGGVKVVVRTAGALRSEPGYCDIHTLPRQRERAKDRTKGEKATEVTFRLSGVRMLSRQDTDDLRRAVRLLHAVVAGEACERTSMGGCPGQRPWMQPLDNAVRTARNRYPALHRLIRRYSMGSRRINCDLVGAELADLWTHVGGRKWNRGRAACVVERFWRIATVFTNNQSMRVPFAEARRVLRESGWREKDEGRRAA